MTAPACCIKNTRLCLAFQQSAEQPVQFVIPRSRRRRGISCVLHSQSEIPRCARNDTPPDCLSAAYYPASLARSARRNNALLKLFHEVANLDRIRLAMAPAHDGIGPAGGINLNGGPDQAGANADRGYLGNGNTLLGRTNKAGLDAGYPLRCHFDPQWKPEIARSPAAGFEHVFFVSHYSSLSSPTAVMAHAAPSAVPPSTCSGAVECRFNSIPARFQQEWPSPPRRAPHRATYQAHYISSPPFTLICWPVM
jgi:hypothetical protein